MHISIKIVSTINFYLNASSKTACRSNFRPFIKVLLSFFIRSRHFFLSFFLSLFLSFIPGLSHTTTQTAASSHLLTDADGGGGAAGYYDTSDDDVDILVSIPIIRRTYTRIGFIQSRYAFVELVVLQKLFRIQTLRVYFFDR